jgi:arsenate reductase
MRILFLCTGNSCRSQMAEAWARALHPHLEAYSAGVEKHGLNPWAMRVLEEAGLDTSTLFSKTTDELPVQEFDVVITLCSHAQENCPFFPGATRRMHRGFDDPPRMVTPDMDEAEILGVYRRVREEIRRFVERLPAEIGASA